MRDFLYFMVQSSLLIVLVYGIGKAGKGSLSARARYGLWLIVLVRLLFPFVLIPVSWSGAFSVPHPYAVMQEALDSRRDRAGEKGAEAKAAGSAGGWKNAAGTKAAVPADHAGPGGIRGAGGVAGAGDSKPEEMQQGSAAAGDPDNSGFARHTGREGTESGSETSGRGIAAAMGRVGLLWAIWLTGCLITGSIFIIQNVRFFRKIRRGAVKVKTAGRIRIRDERSSLPVFYRNNLASPCLAGIVRPEIYVNDRAMQNEEIFRMVVLHEQMHFRQKEPIWNLLRNLLCVVYWFHPLVWLGACISRKDAELACDEGVVADMNKEERRQYGMALLELASGKKAGILEVATAINGGKKEMALRIRMIARRQRTKKSVWAAALAVVLAVGIVGCTRAEVLPGESRADAGVQVDGENETDAGTVAGTDAETSMDAGQTASGESAVVQATEPALGQVVRIAKKEALFSAATVLGADGPQFVYADDEVVIFHEYFGLVVFRYAQDGQTGEAAGSQSSFSPGIIDTLDLSSIGCSATQGDAAAEVRASKGGKQLYLRTMNGQVFYRYDRTEQALYRCSMDLWPGEEDLYQRPEGEDREFFHLFDEKKRMELVVGEIAIDQSLVGGQEDIALWTEGSSDYMRALKKEYDSDSAGRIVDEGWNGGYGFDPETVEDLGGSEGRWYKIVRQVDEGGNRVDNPYERAAWFATADGEKMLAVRSFDDLVCTWKDLLIYRYDDTVYVTKDDKIAPFFSLDAGKDFVRFYAWEDVLCAVNETASTMTFYDRAMRVMKEYRDVRLSEYSEERYCVMDLNTGLYGYLSGAGREVIPFGYSVAQGFHNGYAAVLTGARAEVYYEDQTVKMFNHIGGCWGIIDKTGSYVIEPSEEFSNSFDREDLGELTQPELIDGPVAFDGVDEMGRVKFILREDGRVLREVWLKK